MRSQVVNTAPRFISNFAAVHAVQAGKATYTLAFSPAHTNFIPVQRGRSLVHQHRQQPRACPPPARQQTVVKIHTAAAHSRKHLSTQPYKGPHGSKWKTLHMFNVQKQLTHPFHSYKHSTHLYSADDCWCLLNITSLERTILLTCGGSLDMDLDRWRC